MAYIADAENAVLAPTLERAEQEASRGMISKIGPKLTEHTMKIGAAVLIGTSFSPEAGLASLLLQTLAQEASSALTDHAVGKNKSSSPVTVWTKLFAHSKTVQTEVPRGQEQNGELDSRCDWWGIPSENSLTLHVSEGILIWDHIPEGELPRSDGGYPSDDAYLPCPCGSGRKFRFCCKGLERYDFRQL